MEFEHLDQMHEHLKLINSHEMGDKEGGGKDN